MRLNQLIALLTKLQEEHGDIPCFCNGEYGANDRVELQAKQCDLEAFSLWANSEELSSTEEDLKASGYKGPIIVIGDY